MGRPHWPHWATGTRGLQAGQDLAWGPADTAWNRSRRVLFSPPGPGARLYQSTLPTILRMYPNPYNTPPYLLPPPPIDISSAYSMLFFIALIPRP